MKKLSKYGRLWHCEGDDSLLSPWAENSDKIPGTLIKQNRKRTVWRVTSSNGNDYFVKREMRFHFPFTTSKAEKEFKAFSLLKEKGIPCAEYAAWSAGLRDCIVVSKALPDGYTSILQYWFSRPDPDFEFAAQLCRFLARTAKAGVTHPDFHAGNLMTDGKNIVLIDPIGIKSAPPTDSPAPEMLIPLSILTGDLSMDHLAEMLHASGLYSSREHALEQLNLMESRQRALINGEWEKRKNQILSGSSKFARETEPGFFIRNNAWFSPAPEICAEELEKQEYSAEEGTRIWTESFRAQLLKQKLEKIPVFFQIRDNHAVIYYLKEKKNSFFYGFR